MLVTVKDNIPRATPVDFFNDRLTIWIIGEPGVKMRNIRSNPRVAVGIYHPLDHSKLNRSLQIQGKAKLITLRNHRKEFMMRVKRFGIIPAVEKVAGEFAQGAADPKAAKKDWIEKTFKRLTLIRIDPAEITFLCLHPTRGRKKDVWEKRAQS